MLGSGRPCVCGRSACAPGASHGNHTHICCNFICCSSAVDWSPFCPRTGPSHVQTGWAEGRGRCARPPCRGAAARCEAQDRHHAKAPWLSACLWRLPSAWSCRRKRAHAHKHCLLRGEHCLLAPVYVPCCGMSRRSCVQRVHAHATWFAHVMRRCGKLSHHPVSDEQWGDNRPPPWHVWTAAAHFAATLRGSVEARLDHYGKWVSFYCLLQFLTPPSLCETCASAERECVNG
jgi:hypothetical protein